MNMLKQPSQRIEPIKLKPFTIGLFYSPDYEILLLGLIMDPACFCDLSILRWSWSETHASIEGKLILLKAFSMSILTAKVEYVRRGL
jgi:hypothetical protein